MKADVSINNTQIVNFGLGKLGIFQTQLQDLSEEGDGYLGIVIERYAEVNKLGEIIPDERDLTKTGDDIVLVFHTIESVYDFRDHLYVLANSLRKEQKCK